MDFFDVVQRRRSTRNFSGDSVGADVIKRLIDCGRLAPTANNVQPWNFVVVTGKEKLARIGRIAPNGSFVRDAPACIVVFCKDTKYYLEDGCAATENIILAATAMGLATCWIAGDKKPYTEEIRGLFYAPVEYKLVSMIAVGGAGEPQEPPVKRPLNDVIHWESF